VLTGHARRFDVRDRYSDEWEELAWVQVLGDVHIVEMRDAGDALASVIAKYAPYGTSPPPGPLLALDPDRCLFWRAAGDQAEAADR